MSLLLGQMFSRCNVPSPPADGTYQLMFARRPGDGEPLPTLPTGHWGGTGRDTASTFYGDLADLTHVKTAVVYDRWGNDGNIYDFGFKVVSSINTNTTEQNTCQVQLDTEGENPFGGFCFEGVTGNVYICFGFECSFYTESDTFPMLEINLYAGRGGTEGTPLQTWTLSDMKGTDDVLLRFANAWPTFRCMLQLSNDVIDIVSNRWDGAIVEFIAAPNGWNEEYHQPRGGATDSTMNPYPSSNAYLLADSTVSGSSSTGCEIWTSWAQIPVTNLWEACSSAAGNAVKMTNETYDPAYFEVGFEKPTIGVGQWTAGGHETPTFGFPPSLGSIPDINAPGYWNEYATDAINSKSISVTLSGNVPITVPPSTTGREIAVTVTADGYTLKTLLWNDDESDWDSGDEASEFNLRMLKYTFSESEWGALTRYEQERFQVKVEISGVGDPYEYIKIHGIIIGTGPAAWMGIYMPRGSNAGTFPDWTGYSAPDTGLVTWFGDIEATESIDDTGTNRLGMIQVIEST